VYFPWWVKEPHRNIPWCNTLLVLTLPSDVLCNPHWFFLVCCALAVYRVPNGARCWAPKEEEKPRAGQKDGCIGGSDGPALAGHHDGSRAIPPSKARLQLARAWSIIQSLIASCSSSFLTGMPSRSPSSPPTAPGLSSSCLLPPLKLTTSFGMRNFYEVDGTPF
jgi:hypothetical protein